MTTSQYFQLILKNASVGINITIYALYNLLILKINIIIFCVFIVLKF